MQTTTRYQRVRSLSLPDIRFFEECNPTWAQGTELPCIARADLWAFATAIVPFLRKALRDQLKGRPAPLGVDQSEDETVRPD